MTSADGTAHAGADAAERRDDGALDRALRVLDCLDADEPALTAAQLASRTRLPASTLHRLLARLVDAGLLVRVEGHRYAVGARLWELGELSPLSLRLRETALPHMSRLHEATGENVHLAVLDGADPATATALYVGRVAGRGSFPTLSRMGGRHPLHTTGVGKALLSTCDEAWLERHLAGPLERETVHSIASPTRLRAEVEQARVLGYATTREEMTLGTASVAAPLLRVDGLPAAAIGVVVRLGEADARHLAGIVVQTARELSAELRAQRSH